MIYILKRPITFFVCGTAELYPTLFRVIKARAFLWIVSHSSNDHVRPGVSKCDIGISGDIKKIDIHKAEENSVTNIKNELGTDLIQRKGRP